MNSIRKISFVALSMLLAAECAVSTSYSALAYDDETAFFDVDSAEEFEEIDEFVVEEIDEATDEVSSEDGIYEEIEEVVPVEEYADDESAEVFLEEEYAETENEVLEEKESDSSCGEHAAWNFDTKTGVLTISGSGDMYDYSEENPAPWSKYSGSVKKIVFDPDITSIGAYAFYKMKLVGDEFKDEDVVLPEVLKSIGDFAFSYFNGREITLPRSVESIGESAFMRCELDQIYGFMPRDIKYIKNRAFYDARFSSNYATVPATVISIGDEAFRSEHDLIYFYFMGDMPEFGKDVFAGAGKIWIYYSKDNTTWKKLKHGNDSIIYENLATYTITFVDPYGNESEEAYLQGDFVRLPKVSLHNGDVISAWYRENEDAPGFQTKYLKVRDNTRVSEDEKITARLEGADCKVRFITAKDVENIPADQVLRPGDKVTEPGPVYRENHTFRGWRAYNAPVGKTYDFDTPVTEDVVLYGWWSEEGSIEVSAEDVTYTGKALYPEVKVIANGALAVKGRDYTVKYSNNVNAGTGHFAVTLKGNYKGSASGTFKINPADIADESKVTVADKEVFFTYDGKPHYGKTTVKADVAGKTVTLKEGVDYSYSYDDETSRYTESGESRIVIKGRGNYSGRVQIKQVIYKDNLLADAKVDKLGSFAYTGQEIRPEVTVTYNKKVLKAGEDFTVSYENNIAAGTATAIITAIEGSGFVGSKKVTFTINGTDLSKAKIFGVEKKSYDGTAKVLDDLKLTVTGKDKKPVELRKMDEESYLEIKGTKAAEAVDYIYSYENNVNAGNAKVILTGVNGYQGTVTKTFVIAPKNADETITATVAEKAVYKKTGAEPEISVVYRNGDVETTLSKGTDYTVSYSKNKKVGAAKATITLKGNFKGKINKPFTVEKADIAGCSATAIDIIEREKPGINTPSITVTDADGNKLAAGKDYSKKVVYRYAEDKVVDVKKGKELEPAQRYKGDKVLPGDIVYGVTSLYAEITGAGGYEGTLISENFDVKCYSIASAKVHIYPQPYSSKGVEPGKSYLTVTVGKETLKDTDYEIIGYENNHKVGTATIILKGCGKYGGIKKAKFKIKVLKSSK